MKTDFLIPASLTDGFCGQIAFFRLCLDALSDSYTDTRLVAVFGDPDVAEIPLRWRKHFDRIGVEWAYSESGSSADEAYQAQHLRRFELFRPDCDLVILCDADVAPLRSLDTLANRLVQRSAVGGVIAHSHFPWEGREKNPAVDWAEISQAVLGRDIDRPFRYTLMPHNNTDRTPFYINYGVLAAPPQVMAALNESEREIRDQLHSLVGKWWGPQISIPLSCARIGLNTEALPMRYNFPNDPRADNLYPEELDQVIFMHYLRMSAFRRDRIFTFPNAFERFINRQNLQGSNEVFRQHVLKVTGGNYPFLA